MHLAEPLRGKLLLVSTEMGYNESQGGEEEMVTATVREAMLYEKLPGSRVRCHVCQWRCVIELTG